MLTCQTWEIGSQPDKYQCRIDFDLTFSSFHCDKRQMGTSSSIFAVKYLVSAKEGCNECNIY